MAGHGHHVTRAHARHRNPATFHHEATLLKDIHSLRQARSGLGEVDQGHGRDHLPGRGVR